jgi:hypothetical protein
MKAGEKIMQLLYHYTSIETLALILKNKTICFNNLLNVDDLDEADTQDMGLFGKYVNVSCWTTDVEESIPLWNLYTPQMKGIRIGLPPYPFKKYNFKAGTFGLKNDIETYIDIEKIYHENRGAIVAEQPSLYEVKYTDDANRLFPEIRECNDIVAYRRYLETGEIENSGVGATYSFKDIGMYKRSNWSFQKEWRYKITNLPLPLKEIESNHTTQSHLEFARRIENIDYPAPYDKLFLSIDENYLKSLEVLLGPRMSEGEKIIVKALLNEYCPDASIKESSLKIKI